MVEALKKDYGVPLSLEIINAREISTYSFNVSIYLYSASFDETKKLFRHIDRSDLMAHLGKRERYVPPTWPKFKHSAIRSNV